MFFTSRILALFAAVQCLNAAVITDFLSKEHKIVKRDGENATAYEVKSLPGLEDVDKSKVPAMHAGYLDIDKSLKKEYFFWRFAKTQKPDDKLIFWYNGGPGCSSMDGALLESGPLRVTTDDKLVYKEGTWLETGDLVYVDQPAGTGYSVSDKDDAELTDIAADMLVFFEKYFTLFPEDLKKDIYLGGESYAGQYIPYFAAEVLAKAKGKYNLKGLIIINGYIYPDVQNYAIFDYAVQNNIISEEQFKSNEIQSSISKCKSAIKESEEKFAQVYKIIEQTGIYEGKPSGSDDNKVENDECSQILEQLLDMTLDKSAPKDQQCLNQYDHTLNDSYPSCGMNWPVEEKQLKAFLNEKKVSLDLNLDKKTKWEECADAPYSALVNYNSYPAFFKLPFILKQIPVMLMVGENDIVCNINGMEDMVSQLTWGNATSAGYSKSIEYQDFKVGNGETVGKVKHERGLWIARVHNASHMIPYDHPVASRGAIDLFFGNYKQQDNSYVAPTYGGY